MRVRAADLLVDAIGASRRLLYDLQRLQPQGGAMRVLSDRAVREIVDGARTKADNAHQFSLAAEARLGLIKTEAREAAARLEKLREHAYALDDLGRPA